MVDYVNDPKKVARLLLRARADGFVPCAAPDRGLKTMCAPVRVQPKLTC